jgi:hypothetical protein
MLSTRIVTPIPPIESMQELTARDGLISSSRALEIRGGRTSVMANANGGDFPDHVSARVEVVRVKSPGTFMVTGAIAETTCFQAVVSVAGMVHRDRAGGTGA